MATQTRPPVDDLRVEILAKESYLKPAQREELQENIRRDEAYLHGRAANGQPLAMVPGIPIPDIDMVRENMARDSAMLEAGTPPKLTPLQIRQHMRRLDELDTEITPGMPSIDQMQRPLGPNIDMCIAHERVNKVRVLARKTILSRLDPENDEPNFRSKELLRTNDPPTVDLRQYWRNYELIKWQKEAAVEVEDLPLDEETFLKFCQFKAADWSPKLIRRELALSDVQYEQAMTRLQTMRAQAMPEDDEGGTEAHGPEAVNGQAPVLVPSEAPEPSSNGHLVYPVLAVDFTVDELRAVMSRMGLSQRKFAEAVGVTVSVLQIRILKHGRMTDTERLAVLRVYHQFTQGAQVAAERTQETDAPALVGTEG